MNYEALVARLLALLNGTRLPLPRWGDLERNEERVAFAVCDINPMLSLDRWDRLDRLARQPWLERTIDSLVRTQAGDEQPGSQVPACEPGEAQQESPTTEPLPLTPVDEEIIRFLLETDPRLATLDPIVQAITQSLGSVSRKTVSSRLHRVSEPGLVHRPEGDRKGWGLTNRGREWANTLLNSPGR